MKRNLLFLMGVFIISVASCSFTNKTFESSDKDKVLIELITYVLDKGHFDPKDVDDNFSENVFYAYIESLDPLKRFFLASDIKQFEKYKYQIDDQLQDLDITFFNLTYERLMERMEESAEIYRKVLDSPFNFDKKETIDTNYDELAFASTKRELKDRWRKQVKFSTLSGYLSRIEEEEQKKDKDASYKMTSEKELEEKARESTLKTFDEFFSLSKDLERKDWFSQYINSIVEEFDPHTFYLAPNDKERFDINISGKFEGIGARLQKRNDNIRVTDVISGGPAWRGQEVEVGDEILKVAQGKEEPVSIVGMRLDDAVKLIKGPKGTEVKLTLKRVDGTIEVVSIIRDVVELEESYAKSSLVKKNNRTFGIINLPKFYIDFDNYKERNAASDVAKEIDRLKREGMEGLVLDLRDNGGGSLKTVVDMAGLFIKKGPIVQVKTTGPGKEVLSDTDERVQWDGPLVILVNELSASASEILAAAMQDYKRAIVIGSKQTYGKGTVQNVIDLNQFLKRNNEFGDVGSLKLTTQKFYRINGGSTQLEGVKSDVIIPDKYSYIEIGEKDQDNPLPWDKIAPAEYEPWKEYIDYEKAIKRSEARMADNSLIKLIDENARWIKQQQDDYIYPLNMEAYKKDLEVSEEKAKYFKAISEYQTNLTFESPLYEQKLFTQDTVLREKRDRWHKNLSQDVYVEEAINVLVDLKLSNIKKAKVAGIKG